ncbi:hypothetical protein AURDEDRAFT_158602 [Auricularia subglabra TFB-10046 SS5]|nr:hypothetical protein AURDEDRAFT_158602 [Auricularia subglabra TFB-10046 SS5]
MPLPPPPQASSDEPAVVIRHNTLFAVSSSDSDSDVPSATRLAQRACPARADPAVHTLVRERDTLLQAGLRDRSPCVLAHASISSHHSRTKELARAQTKIREMTSKLERIEAACECPLCYDTCWVPWVLPDCGHVMCQTCLISFLSSRKPRDKRTLLRPVAYTKCPKCNTEIFSPPVQAFDMHALIAEIFPHNVVDAQPGLVAQKSLAWQNTIASVENMERYLDYVANAPAIDDPVPVNAHGPADAPNAASGIAVDAATPGDAAASTSGDGPSDALISRGI